MSSDVHIEVSTLYKKIYNINNLTRAWIKVKSNGEKSTLKETREKIKAFDTRSKEAISKIQTALRKQSYTFSPARGVLQKRKNKEPRPIIMASVEDRVVQRAILQVLQDHKSVNAVLETPYSFGGLKEKNVEQALKEIQSAIEAGFTFFIRSDINNFFTKIDKKKVMENFSKIIQETDFKNLLQAAIETQLCEEDMVRYDKKTNLFPLEETGIAQGSCLSPLIANIYLFDFDQKMNERGIKCLRYIDDLLFFGKNKTYLEKAFQNGKKFLNSIGLEMYDTIGPGSKAFKGKFIDGVEFLGCNILPGLVQPSKSNREKFSDRISTAFNDSKKAVELLIKKKIKLKSKQDCINTLENVNNIVLGWGHAFSFCDDFQIMKDLDAKITKMFFEYLSFIQTHVDKNPLVAPDILGLNKLLSIANNKKTSLFSQPIK